MTLKSDAKFEEKLTCCLENDMRNLANFYQSTQKCQNRNFNGILLSEVENPCDQSIYCFSYKSTEELSFMTLRSYANFEERLTSGLKKGMRNLANFHQSTESVKIGTLMGSFWPK